MSEDSISHKNKYGGGYKMSLSLENGTQPHGLLVRACGKIGDTKDVVTIGGYALSIEDFLTLASYVLTNPDLRENDPRLDFLTHVESMKMVDGWGGPLSRRLEAETPLKFQGK